MTFQNDYQDTRRAAAYDELDLGNTYDLAFRNLPPLVSTYVKGQRAVDFGCGTGRSARFLERLGMTVLGLDISVQMVERARLNDPSGDYRVIADGDLGAIEPRRFDLVQSAFTFDNVPGFEKKVDLFAKLGTLLDAEGVLINIVSTPEIYTHEWVTFTTRDYPENRVARCGDVVRIRTTDYSDTRPVEDILWPHVDYLRVYAEAGLELVTVERPLARGDEGVVWRSELEIAPWAIYVLRRS